MTIKIKIEDLRIVIQVEGGVVQNICSNSPVPIKVYIVVMVNKNRTLS